MNGPSVIADRYRLDQEIGRGGMAEVWRAHDLRLGRDVAVKLMSPALASDPGYLVRFFSEAQAVASINDRHVVAVLDFGETDDRPFLVMELVTGGCLSDVTGAPVDPGYATTVVAEAARGAGAAHAAGIVHRDIKPGNILLSDEGVKLGDFGIASASGAEKLTATGATLGSPHYMSPEQATGAPVTPASDVYSLGCVLYELLTGTRPFQGDNITAIAIAHAERDPEPPRAVTPDLDPVLDALVMRCLAKDPEQRYRDGNELAAALEAHAQDRPLVAGPVAARAATGGRRRWPAAAALAALLIASGVAYAVVAGPDTQDQTSEDRRALDVKQLEIDGPSPTRTDARAEVVLDDDLEPVVETASPSPTARPTDDARDRSRPRKEEPDQAEPEPTPTYEPEPTEEPTSNPTPQPS